MKALADIATASEARESVYSFLSRMFQRELTKEIVVNLAGKTGPLLESGAFTTAHNQNLREGLRMLTAYVESVKSRDIQKVLTELTVDYSGLFLGVWGSPAHPSESAYLTGMTMGKQTEEIHALYESVGVSKPPDFVEPEDHIALELAFMATLAGRTRAAASSGDVDGVVSLTKMQIDFIDKHLSAWIGRMTEDILHQGRIDFYKAIGLITSGFIEEDGQALGNAMAELKD